VQADTCCGGQNRIAGTYALAGAAGRGRRSDRALVFGFSPSSDYARLAGSCAAIASLQGCGEPFGVGGRQAAGALTAQYHRLHRGHPRPLPTVDVQDFRTHRSRHPTVVAETSPRPQTGSTRALRRHIYKPFVHSGTRLPWGQTGLPSAQPVDPIARSMVGSVVPRVQVPALYGPSFPPWTTTLRRSVAE
jgi:hypothetical protein